MIYHDPKPIMDPISITKDIISEIIPVINWCVKICNESEQNRKRCSSLAKSLTTLRGALQRSLEQPINLGLTSDDLMEIRDIIRECELLVVVLRQKMFVYRMANILASLGTRAESLNERLNAYLEKINVGSSDTNPGDDDDEINKILRHWKFCHASILSHNIPPINIISLEVNISDTVVGDSTVGPVYAGTYQDVPILATRVTGIHETEAYLMKTINIGGLLGKVSGTANILGASIQGRNRYLIVEKPDGVRLYDKILEGSISDDNKILISFQISASLELIHQTDIIHKDLRSANIYHGKEDVILSGLEISRMVNERSRPVDVDSVMKKWWAPEKLSGDGDSKKCDIYSLGCVLWEIQTGKVPFAGETFNTVKYKVTQGQRENLNIVPDERVRNIIKLCWSQKPEDRPTAKDVTLLLISIPK